MIVYRMYGRIVYSFDDTIRQKLKGNEVMSNAVEGENCEGIKTGICGGGDQRGREYE